MSDFLAEARVVVRPDTTRFRAELEAQLAAATAKPIVVPVVAAAAGGVTALTTETAALSTTQTQAAASTQTLAANLEAENVAALQAASSTQKLAVSQAAAAASTGQLERGVGASTLSLLGIRGATLAASGSFLAGAAAVTLFAQSLKSAAAFQTELKVFAVNSGATADQMERVSAAAKALGRDITLPGVTAQTAAVAMTELAKAGLSVEDAVAGARGALQLATAAEIDVTASTKLVANTLNAFGLAGGDAVKVADLLAGAAKSAQGEIGEFGTALGQVASVADQFGVSAADTVTLLTQLAKSGLQGGRAGTTLRVAILGLIKPTAAAAVELDKLKKAGVEITKPNGAFNPTAFAQINTALQAYSKEQQNVVRNTIFSSDAIKVLGRATAGGVQDFNNINKAVSESGLAVQAASARTSGLSGDFENLSNQVGGLQLTVGTLAQGPVSVLVDKLATTAQNANSAADGLITMGNAVGTLADDIAKSVPIIGKFAKALETIANFQIDPVGGIGDALRGIADRAKAAATGLQQAIAQNVAGLRDVPGLKEFADQLNLFIGAIEKSGPPAKAAMDKVVGAVTDGVDQIGAAGKRLNTGLNVKQIQNVVTGFDAKETRDKIAKDNKQLLADLQAEQDFLRTQLQRQYVKNRPELKRALEQALLGTVNDIDALQGKAKTETQRVANDAKQNATKLAQAILSNQSLARDELQNKIEADSVAGNIKAQLADERKLRNLVLAQIEEVKKRISLEGGRKAAIVALRAILNQISKETKSLLQQQQADQKAQRDALLQGISLDIAFDQTTNNQKREIADRERLIAALKVQLATLKKGTNAYKEIRNQIAEQNAAIAAITAEKKKQNNALGQAEFEFLQAQQGFASTLLGNLIPRGATGGLVGGSQAPVQGALQPVAGAAEARSQSGVTSGQGNATNHLLQQILAQLKELNGETKAPEATKQRANQWSVMDGVGGG